MRKFITSALILSFAGLLGTAGAQDGKKMVAQAEVVELMLLRQKSVRTDLKLEAGMDKKIYEFTHKQHQTAEEVHKLPENQQKERWEMMMKQNDEFLHTFSVEQRKRLKQIAMQVAGLLLVTKPSIAKEIHLTDDQKQQVLKLQAKSREKVHELMEPAAKETRNEKLAALRKPNDEALQMILTADQKSKWKEMTGAPFKGQLVFEEVEKTK